jgi:hypothetical protein
MELDDPTSGREASIERQFASPEECFREAGIFAKTHPDASYYCLPNGISFENKRDGDIEYRFVYPGSASITYYVAMDGTKPVKNFGQFQKLFTQYTTPPSKYKGKKPPHEDGGRDGQGNKTARCRLQSDDKLLGPEFGLIINPPFPHGSPGSDSDKNHGRGGKWRGANGYLLVLAGLVAGLTFNPLRKALRKRWSFFGS